MVRYEQVRTFMVRNPQIKKPLDRLVRVASSSTQRTRNTDNETTEREHEWFEHFLGGEWYQVRSGVFRQKGEPSRVVILTKDSGSLVYFCRDGCLHRYIRSLEDLRGFLECR